MRLVIPSAVASQTTVKTAKKSSTPAASGTLLLGQKLTELQKNASVVAGNLRTANQALYLHLAELYMWWRDAKDVDGYLDTAYATTGKKYKTKVKHGINFAPLFWLTWGFDNGLTDDKTNRWSMALNKVHEQYEAHKQYHKDSVAKLQNYIATSGGVDGLVDYGAATGDDSDDLDDDEGDLWRAPDAPPITNAEMEDAIFGTAKNFYSSVTAPATIDLKATIPLTADGFGLVLVRKFGDKFQLVGASSDEALVQPVTTQTYLRDYTALPVSIRVVVETISTQCLPKRLQSFYKNLIDDAPAGTGNKGAKSVRRLMYRHSSGEFVLSPMRAQSGVVTVAKPKHAVLENVKQDTFLSTRSRRALERRLISGWDFNLYAPADLTVIPEYRYPNLASHAIRLQHSCVKNDYLHLDFWPFYDTITAPRGQLIATGMKAGSGTWHGSLSLAWVRKFAFDFTTPWLQSHGTHIKRSHQNVFRLDFSKTALTVHFVYRDGRFEGDSTVEFGTAATSTNPITVFVLTKDFAIAAQAVADLGVISAVAVDVNADVLSIQFSTTAADYRIYVPTCSIDGVRSSKHFSQYEPMAVVNDPNEDYYDPAHNANPEAQ